MTVNIETDEETEQKGDICE